MPGNCSDEKPYFLSDYQGITAFVLFDRDARGDGIPAKNRDFLSEISVLSLPRAVTIYPQTTPFFGRTQTTIPFERDTISGKIRARLEK